MAVIEQAVSLLTEFQGGLALQLTLTIAAGLLFAVAQATHAQRGDTATAHWALAAGLLAVARLGLMLVLVITALAGPEAEAFLAPLERYLSLAGALALAWAFTSLLEDPLGNHLFAAAQGLAMLGLLASMIAFAIGPPPANFNQSAEGMAWDVAGLAWFVAIELGLLLRRPRQWKLASVGFGFLIAGLILQLSFGWAIRSSAGYLRLGELAAYPILALAGARALGSLPGWSSLGLVGAADPGKALAEAKQRLEDLRQENDRLLARLLASRTDASGAEIERAERNRQGVLPRSGPEERPVAYGADRSADRLRGTEDSPEVAKLKAEFKLALQELASLSHDRSAARSDASAGAVAKPTLAGPVGALTAMIQDMRQTLISAGSSVELLRGATGIDVDQEQRAFLDRLEGDIQRLVDQVEKLSSLTTERAAAPTPPDGQVDPLRSIRTSLAQARHPLHEKELSVALDLADGLPFLAVREEDFLRLVSLMIDHARISSSPGGVIELSAYPQPSDAGTWLVLAMTDAGAGFAPEELARVFQPSVHQETSARGEPRLSSPTLAEIKLAAGGMGGRVWVSSEPGAGMTITVLLPAGTPPSAPLA